MNQHVNAVNTGGIAPLHNVSICLDVAYKIMDRPVGVDGLGLFYGHSGYGKSKASQFVQNKTRAIYLECFDFWTRKVFIQNLLVELEVSTPRGTIADMMQQAIALLQDDPNRLLIIDEADKLVDKGHIELVRDLYKGAKIPVLLVGEERLPDKLARYERCENRVTCYGMANPCDLRDAAALAQTYHPNLTVETDLLERIVSKTGGVASRIVTTLAGVSQAAKTSGKTVMSSADFTGQIFTGRAPRRGQVGA